MNIKFPKRKKNYNKRENPNPDFLWRMLLLFAFLIVLASGVFGFYLFLEVNKEPDIQTEDGNSLIVNKKRIDTTLEYFSSREKKSSEILNSPSPVIDPSL